MVRFDDVSQFTFLHPVKKLLLFIATAVIFAANAKDQGRDWNRLSPSGWRNIRPTGVLEPARLIVIDRLSQFGMRVHDEGSAPGNRFIELTARDQ